MVWGTEVSRASIPADEAPKVKLVYGPSRAWGEEHLPAECGTYWGRMQRMTMREYQERKKDPPPPYSGPRPAFHHQSNGPYLTPETWRMGLCPNSWLFS